MRTLLGTAALAAALLLFTSCSRDTGKEPSGPEVRVRIVHDPAVAGLMGRFVELFRLSSPRLSTGERVAIDLVLLNDVQAAKLIASGRVKSEAWLAPSASLIDFTNANLSNLGPAQADCLALFSTPIVAATLGKNTGFAGANGSSFSWRQFFSERVSAPGSSIALLHASPSSSPSGLAGLIQLAYMALEPGSALNLETLRSKTAWARLAAFESRVSNYGASDDRLLEKSSSTIASRVRFAITSEQALAKFNQGLAADKPKLTALYPDEGSVWLDYQLCASKADWVTPAHAAALAEFKKFLSGDEAQSLARVAGFRTAIVKFEKSAPLTEENGINLDLPKKSFNPAPGAAAGYLLKNWTSLAKPSAFALVLDASGSMDGERLAAAKDGARRLIAASAAADLFSLFHFSSEPQTDGSLLSDKKSAIQLIDGYSAAGGSAIYDTLREAIINLSAQRIKDRRKTLILITDGEDKNSTIPLQRLIDFANERCATLDINLIIMALQGDGQDFGDLKKLAEGARGDFIETDSDSLAAAMETLIQSF